MNRKIDYKMSPVYTHKEIAIHKKGLRSNYDLRPFGERVFNTFI